MTCALRQFIGRAIADRAELVHRNGGHYDLETDEMLIEARKEIEALLEQIEYLSMLTTRAVHNKGRDYESPSGGTA
jgi:hypothetical protein